MTDDNPSPVCRKCGQEPAGPGGILGAKCREYIESGAAYERSGS